MSRRRATMTLLAALIALSQAQAQAQGVDRAQAVSAFETVRQVLQHPRCQNCHIPGNAPLQYDQGLPHAMNVQRGADGRGTVAMNCSSCHQTRNLPAEYGPRAPPGAPNWHLPPENMKMVFIDLPSLELCRVLKDPKRNGGKTPAQLVTHVAEDKLVLWGWEPGGERAPVSVPHAQFVAAFKAWVSGGMPCPTR
jgi:mono/diheme cytochrome c family protein